MGKADHSKTGEPSIRLLRVGENVRHAIADVLARGDIQDAVIERAPISVTEVRLSPDLRHAKVYVMPLGGDPSGDVLKALNSHASFIRGEISPRLTMKYMPKLKFLGDDSFDEASKMEKLLADPKVRQDTRKPVQD